MRFLSSWLLPGMTTNLLHNLRGHPAWRSHERLAHFISSDVTTCGEKGTDAEVWRERGEIIRKTRTKGTWRSTSPVLLSGKLIFLGRRSPPVHKYAETREQSWRSIRGKWGYSTAPPSHLIWAARDGCWKVMLPRGLIPAICTEPSSPRRMFPALRSLRKKRQRICTSHSYFSNRNCQTMTFEITIITVINWPIHVYRNLPPPDSTQD